MASPEKTHNLGGVLLLGDIQNKKKYKIAQQRKRYSNGKEDKKKKTRIQNSMKLLSAPTVWQERFCMF